jgi:hypothetical protein
MKQRGLHRPKEIRELVIAGTAQTVREFKALQGIDGIVQQVIMFKESSGCSPRGSDAFHGGIMSTI